MQQFLWTMDPLILMKSRPEHTACLRSQGKTRNPPPPEPTQQRWDHTLRATFNEWNSPYDLPGE